MISKILVACCLITTENNNKIFRKKKLEKNFISKQDYNTIKFEEFEYKNKVNDPKFICTN